MQKSLLSPSVIVPGLRGVMLLRKRVTVTPNIKNFKTLKYIYDIDQAYKFGPVLGEGAFGKVKVATKIRTRKRYAIKMIRKSKMANGEVPQMLLSELNVLQRVEHENIMRVLEMIEDDEKFYIVSELVQGGDLHDRIQGKGKFNEA